MPTKPIPVSRTGRTCCRHLKLLLPYNLSSYQLTKVQIKDSSETGRGGWNPATQKFKKTISSYKSHGSKRESTKRIP